MLAICAFLTSCYYTNKIVPSINVSGNHKWQRIDTTPCRAYYYQNDDYVKSEMKDLNEVYFSVIGLIFPAGFLLGFITAKVAFPIMFICIGCQQLFNGLILKNKYSKILSISFGIL